MYMRPVELIRPLRLYVFGLLILVLFSVYTVHEVSPASVRFDSFVVAELTFI